MPAEPRLAAVTARPRVGALLRLTLGLVEAGYPTTEAFHIAERCARGLGLAQPVIVDLGRAVSVEYVTRDGESVVRTGRTATFGAINCQAMKGLDLLADDVEAGRVAPDDFPHRLDDVLDRPGSNVWLVVSGMSLLAFAIALQVGVGPKAAVVAAVVQALVTGLGAVGGRFAIHRIFLATGQTVLSGVFVGLAHILGLVSWLDAVACLGVPWLLIIPLPVLVAMVVDAVDERYNAATARAFVVVLTSGGVVIGAYAVMTVGSRLDLPAPHNLALPTLPIALGLLFSVIGAVANALANGGQIDLLVPAAALGLLTAAVNQTLLHAAHFSAAWATIIAAVVLGFVSSLWAKRSPYPVSVLALMGITGALIPGLTVYLGIALSMYGESGTQEFVSAVVTGVGLGVGVALGALPAQPRAAQLKRTAPVSRPATDPAKSTRRSHPDR